MERVKKWFEEFTHWYRTSTYALPLLFFLLITILSATFVFFSEVNVNQQFRTIMDGLWWTIITFSTTGYGDKVPVTFGGRIVAVITIFIGVAGMSFLSGTFASVFVDRNSRARRGLMDYPKIKDHIIICGWKDHIKKILLDILRVNEGLSASKIIIISNIETEKVEELKEESELRGLLFVRGDYFSEATLLRANVKMASKVIVLSDTYESTAISEVDSKTVMAVMTIKGMARDVYVCAELLDSKYENYLKQAMCDEILFSMDFSRRMIAGISATSGLSHILYNFVSREFGDSQIATRDIPGEYVGKQYGEYKSAMEAFTDTILLGILENTGSPHRMKMEALRDAQKTSDVSQLVTNLQDVKGLQVNNPNLVPDEEYVIEKYSKAIVLEKKREE